MQGTGFEGAPVSQILVIWTIVGAVLANITDTKHFFYVYFFPEALTGKIWANQFLWRLLGWQACYANSTEVLFASMSFYHLRVIERLWGSRKFASFIALSLLYTTLLSPLVLLLARTISLGYIDYIPSGPTSLLFAILAQFYAAIPAMYKYNVGISPDVGENRSLSFTNKSTSYFLPLQLALSQFPAMLIPSAVGWVVGLAYRQEMLPGSLWRLPILILGARGKTSTPEVEAMRRRLESEAQGQASGAEGLAGPSDTIRRR